MVRGISGSVLSYGISLLLLSAAATLVACSGTGGSGDGSDDPNLGGSRGPATPGPAQPTGTGPKLDCGGGPCNVTSIAMGTLSACVLLADKTVACYGGGTVGSLGRGEAVDGDPYPQRVKDLGDVAAIYGGAYNYCAVKTSGEVYCWGADQSANAYSMRPGALAPAKIEGVSGADQIAISLSHTCALSGGEVYCWGSNDVGELGDGTFDAHAAPVKVKGLADVAQIAVGHQFSCARLRSGEVQCWGFNNNGQLGTADEGHETPQPVPGISGALEIGATTGLNLAATDPAAAGNATSVCALVEGGKVTCWGKRWSGEIAGIEGGKQLRLGWYHACVLDAQGKATCWGENKRGQLGNGSYGDGKTGPSVVGDIQGAKALSVMGNFSCTTFDDGWFACWGDNERGQLGDGSTKNIRPAPVKVRF